MFLNTQKNEIFENHGKRYLIYPLDITVLRELDPVHAKRWIKTGWDIGKTTLLEIRHPTIPHGHPLNIGYASDLFNGLIIAWSRNVYFRVVVFTPNFFQHKTDLLLKIKVWHEKQHLLNTEDRIHKNTVKLTEVEILNQQQEFIRNNLGEKGLEAWHEDNRVNENRLKNANAIPGLVATLWIREYLGTHYKKYAAADLPIPTTPFKTDAHQAHARYTGYWFNYYGYELYQDVSTLFPYTLEDMMPFWNPQQ